MKCYIYRIGGKIHEFITGNKAEARRIAKQIARQSRTNEILFVGEYDI